jgi:phage tail-like protein
MPVTNPGKRDDDPFLPLRFTLNFGGDVKGLIVSCDGLESKSEITEAYSGGLGGRERPASRSPGKLSFTPLQIKLFVLKSDDYFEKWFRQIQDGQLKGATRDGSIKMYDTENRPVAEWVIIAAWPSKIAYSDLDSESNDAMNVTVTLAYEEFHRV